MSIKVYRQIRYSILLIFMAFMYVFSGCGANIFSSDQEVNMGLEFSKEIENQVKMLDNDEWQDYINEVGNSIVGVCDRQDIEYTIKIVDDSSTVNAFALPGGFVYLYSGLLIKADNEAEIAGVIAHEIGHIVGRHGMKKLTSIYGYQLVISLALGTDSRQLERMVADVIVGAGMLKYGRQNEFEADRYGINYTYAAGYDPDGLVTFFEKLGELHNSEPTALEKMLSTHPMPKDRISNARTLITNLPEKTLIYNADRFQAMKKK
ncbi:MAG: M48 family metalloprotease, partial [bacterium]|nr:M48 family metalloprotease [bacterium]